VAVLDLRDFFVRQPALRPWQPYTAWAHWLAARPEGQTVLLAGAPDVFAWDERMRLYGDGKSVSDLTDPTLDVPAQIDPGEPYVVAVNPDNEDWLPLLHQLLPDAHEQV